MTKVIFDMSMSLDGFVKASNATPEQPLGESGERLHQWGFSEDERGREVLAGGGGRLGRDHRRAAYLRLASVVGRRRPAPTDPGVRPHPPGARRRPRRERLHLRNGRHRKRARTGEGGRRGEERRCDGRPRPSLGPVQIIRGRFAVRGASLRSGAPCGAVAPQDRLSSVRR
jgi:hypothetical protein